MATWVGNNQANTVELEIPLNSTVHYNKCYMTPTLNYKRVLRGVEHVNVDGKARGLLAANCLVLGMKYRDIQ